MPLTADDIAALDPNDPTDAATLQAEALYWLGEHDSLQSDFDDLTADFATVSSDVAALTVELEETSVQEFRARCALANRRNEDKLRRT
ncbi:MAG: hypothetical protein ACK4RV_02310 [Caulobacter sp.]